MKVNKFRRGQIWWYETNTVYDGSVQGKTRPVIIISNNIATETATNITVIPCTTKVKRMDIPTYCQFVLNNIDNIALCEQILTINSSKLKDYEGTCDDELMANIAKCIQIAIGLSDIPVNSYLLDTENVMESKIEDKSEQITVENTNENINLTKPTDNRGRHIKYDNDYIIRYINDYEMHDVNFMLKKYNETNARAVANKIYRFRKLLSKGE